MKRTHMWMTICLTALLLHGLPLSPDTSEYKKKLNSINGQVSAINKKIKNLDKEKGSILNQIYKVELQYERELVQANKVRLQLRNTEEKIALKEKERKVLEKQVAKSRKNLLKIVRILYKVGSNTYLKLFIQVDSFDQLFRNYRLFTSLIQHKTAEIESIKRDIKRLNEIRQQLKTEHTTLGELKTQKEQRLRSIRSIKKSKLNLIRKIHRDKDDYRQLLDELKYEAGRLNEVISGRKVKSSLRVIDTAKIKGRLRWPINGKVSSRFGKKKSRRFDTYTVDNGIEIRPIGSDDVRAIFSGDVVFAKYYKGYGNLIIIQHSRDILSLYGHCKKLLKKHGDPVSAGDMIAIAGDTGSTIEKSLYLEIRLNVKPQDPLKWLRKR